MNKEEKNKQSKLLQDRNDHIDKFLESHKKNEKIIPELQKIKDNTILQKGIVDNIPEEYIGQIPVNTNRNL